MDCRSRVQSFRFLRLMNLKSGIALQMILHSGAQLNFQFSLLQLHTKSLCVLALQNSQFEASTSSRPQTVNFEALGHKAIMASGSLLTYFQLKVSSDAFSFNDLIVNHSSRWRNKYDTILRTPSRYVREVIFHDDTPSRGLYGPCKVIYGRRNNSNGIERRTHTVRWPTRVTRPPLHSVCSCGEFGCTET